jgi:GNAT superfamily N-acetyltransferase
LIHSPMELALSAIDEERFGIRTARASGVTLEQLPALMEFCQANDVKLLIARCSVQELPTVHEMSRGGFLLMDTLLYFARDLANMPIPAADDSLVVRPVRVDEAAFIRHMTTIAFQGYQGHYHADKRLEREKCDEVYASWAYSSVMSRDMADEVLVAERQGKIAGFITLKTLNSEVGEGPLYGVDPSLQGHGIGRNLVIGAMRWFEARGVQKMIISTQITNLSSQKVWVRLGFEPSQSYYTFHKWFD